jgi:DNA repair exonuclease SbcCD ATPase subunit
VNSFNKTVNNYVAMISHGMMSIRVSPTATTKAGEERNKISLDVLMNDREVRYGSLSGGEKRRVDVALCLALNKYISEKYDIPNGILGIIIMDEIFSFLDSRGEEAVGALLHEEGKNKTVMVISHTPTLSSYGNEIWTVSKKDGKSYLVNNADGNYEQ